MSTKRQSAEEFKKRIQRQIYLAKESPEPVFDLSRCNLHEVPSGVFPLCKVLQKESLLLYENAMRSFKGGSLNDLVFLKVLDLHSNKLESIPQEICCLKNLQVLNLETNRIKSLPNSCAMLTSLQQLNIKNNKFNNLPDAVTRLYGLRLLDISVNEITILPKEFGAVRTLENLVLDIPSMVYPPKDICMKGIEAIMKFLCIEARIEYIPSKEYLPSTVSLPTSPSNLTFTHSMLSFTFSQSDSFLNRAFQQYESTKERKRQEKLALEKQLDEDYRSQASLAAEAAANKKDLLKFISEEHSKLNIELSSIQLQKSIERDRLIKSIQQVEENTSVLVTKFMEANERARRTEELLDRMEMERLEKEQWYIVRQEELNILRKKDITQSFEKMLEYSDVVGLTIRQYLLEQKEVAKKSMDEMVDMNIQFNNTLHFKDIQKQEFLERLLKEEEVQKEAFEMLLAEKDVCHKRIVSQISLIEQQLSELTLLEVDKRAFIVDSHRDIIEENRMRLTNLLLQLFDERDKRQQELKTRLVEIEIRRQSDQADYWLVQYQRLLDSKPQSLVDQESHLEYKVIEILRRSDASEFMPQFARRRITIETMMQLDDGDLIEIGVSSAYTRQIILSTIKAFSNQSDKDETQLPLPCAPPLDDIPTSPTEVTNYLNECVVCLSEHANVLFLTCGHICTCLACSETLTLCPMDRSHITQKIKVFKVGN